MINYTTEQIDSAFEELSPLTRRALYRVESEKIKREIAQKYSQGESQQDIYLYITCVEVGLMSITDLETNIVNHLKIDPDSCKKIAEETKSLLVKIENKINFFKKVEDIADEEENPIPTPPYTEEDTEIETIIEPQFMNMPEQVQVAIRKSGWKERLYEISKKYKLSIEQMGILEDLTTKVISNTILPDRYEAEVASKITLQEDEQKNIVSDINENILKKIRELMKEQDDVSVKKEEGAPIPPYVHMDKSDKSVSATNNIENKILGAQRTIDVISGEKQKEMAENSVFMENKIPKETEIQKPTQQVPNIFNIPKNQADEKPKNENINTPGITTTPKTIIDTSKTHDPYREEI